MHPDDERLGELLRALRKLHRYSQRQLASLSGIPRDDVAAIEAGRAGEVRLERLRVCLAPLDARLKTTAWWRGAAADRLLDESHARLVEQVVLLLVRRGWRTASEVTFSDYGERGSIDVFAGHEPTASLLVGEVKASLGSLEEMNRTLDVTVRLAPKICRARFGWAPRVVSRLLILPNDRTARRVVERHAQTMTAIYPQRGRDVREWLWRPTGSLSAIWFVSDAVNSRHFP
jgi:transcriptional regulator with XRE-family HTH domain